MHAPHPVKNEKSTPTRTVLLYVAYEKSKTVLDLKQATSSHHPIGPDNVGDNAVQD